MACSRAVTTIQNPQMMVHEMPLAKTVDLEHTPINIIQCRGVVTLVLRSKFQAL
jgi:hypothetical protein